jgi:hypothetical protein
VRIQLLRRRILVRNRESVLHGGLLTGMSVLRLSMRLELKCGLQLACAHPG